MRICSHLLTRQSCPSTQPGEDRSQDGDLSLCCPADLARHGQGGDLQGISINEGADGSKGLVL